MKLFRFDVRKELIFFTISLNKFLKPRYLDREILRRFRILNQEDEYLNLLYMFLNIVVMLNYPTSQHILGATMSSGRAAVRATRWTSWGPGRPLAAGLDNGKHISRIKTEVFQIIVE